MREEELAKQLREIIQCVSLPEPWQASIFEQINLWKEEEANALQANRDKLQNDTKTIQDKLDRLLDAHLDGTITKDEYLPRKEKLLNEKADLQDKLAKLDGKGSVWLEPTKNFFEAAFQASKVARDEDLGKLKDFFQTSGSNVRLGARAPRCYWPEPWSILGDCKRF